MSLLSALTILRDVAAIFLMLSVGVMAYLLFSGGVLSVGVIGSVLTAAAAGAAALAVYGSILDQYENIGG